MSWLYYWFWILGLTTCQWSGNACSYKPCTDLTTNSECTSLPTCKWSDDACFTKSCTDYTESECTEITTCKWNDDACTDKTCADYTTESECTDITTCQWSGNACSIKSTIPDIINERDGVFGLKSSILIFLIYFLF